MAKIQEKVLLSRIEQKDKNAFVKAYDLYIDEIYRFVFFKVGNREEAEDLTSAVFLKAWNYVQESDNDLKFRTLKPLLYRIARTTVIDHYRRRNRPGSVSIDDERNPVEIVDAGQNLEEQTGQLLDIRKVSGRILELKDEYREVIIMRYIEEFSIGEIAKIMDKSRGNVRVLTYRALKALRELLDEH